MLKRLSDGVVYLAFIGSLSRAQVPATDGALLFGAPMIGSDEL